MTEAEYILADIVLLKFPVNQPFTTAGLYHHILVGIQDKYSHAIYEEIKYLVVSSNDSTRQFLLREHYIDVVDYRLPKDKLTEKGEKAQKLGGHKQYQEWEAAETKKKSFQEFPKKQWHLYDLLKIIIGIIITSSISWMLGYKMGEKKNLHNIPIDTLRLPHPVSPPTKALSSPKTSSKRDSL